MTRLSVCIAAALASFNLMAADVPPSIASQPSSQAAHPGFSITLNATASGTAPLRFQWRFNGADLAEKTNSTLTLTNLQSTQAGNYTVVVTNNAGAATSQVARLQIVSGFTLVTNSTLARGGTRPLGAAWGDFNNDGWVDLIASTTERYIIHTNRGDGTFQAVTNRILGGDVNGGRTGMAWADFDNDGNLGLAIGGDFTLANTSLYLYRNRGDGQFDRVATNIFLTSAMVQYSTAWADYDNDGLVDLFIPTASTGGEAEPTICCFAISAAARSPESAPTRSPRITTRIRARCGATSTMTATSICSPPTEPGIIFIATRAAVSSRK